MTPPILLLALHLTLCPPSPAIDHWSAAYDFPSEVAEAVRYIEGWCDPLAYNPWSGAWGEMQIIPGTAEYIEAMTGIPAQEILSNQETNIQAGVWLLALWWHRFDHDLDLTLASYYGGAAQVIECNCVPDWGEHYVDKVRGVLGWRTGDICQQGRCLMEDAP